MRVSQRSRPLLLPVATHLSTTYFDVLHAICTVIRSHTQKLYTSSLVTDQLCRTPAPPLCARARWEDVHRTDQQKKATTLGQRRLARLGLGFKHVQTFVLAIIPEDEQARSRFICIEANGS